MKLTELPLSMREFTCIPVTLTGMVELVGVEAEARTGTLAVTGESQWLQGWAEVRAVESIVVAAAVDETRLGFPPVLDRQTLAKCPVLAHL